MRKTNDQGFFTMDLANQVARMKDLEAAKVMCRQAIDQREGARPENVRKAHQAVNVAPTVNKLVASIVNFSLAHQGFSVLK